MDEKNCHHLLEHLSDYLDGNASAAICAEIDKHLQDCKDCQVVVDTLDQTIQLYRNLPKSKMPEQMRERLYKKLDLKQFFSSHDS